MRRTGIWQQAIGHARSIVESCQAQDRLCLITFDQQVDILLGFRQWMEMTPSQAKGVAMDLLDKCRPGWGQTRMDMAIMTALEAIETDMNGPASLADLASELIVISDMECPPEALEGLQGLSWPKGIKLVPIALACKAQSDATLELVSDRGQLDRQTGLQIKVASRPSSRQDRFRIRWSGSADLRPVDVYVQPGGTTVLEIPPRAIPDKLVLEGDDEDFGNSLFIVPRKARSTVVYVGASEASDPGQQPFYLRRALQASNRHLLTVQQPTSLTDEQLEATAMVVLGPGQYQDLGRLASFVQRGGLVLVAGSDLSLQMSIRRIAALQDLPSMDVDTGQAYAMIAKVDTSHPILAEFAQPRYSSFTQVHIWRYTRFDISNIQGCRPLVWLDNGDPVMFELSCGKGAIVVLAFAWSQPDSDLALSSKFVPMLYGLLEYASGLVDLPTQFFIGQALPLPDGPAVLITPDGSRMELAPDHAFGQTETPGIYVSRSDKSEQAFAVNMWPDETRPWPMVLDRLDAVGIPVANDRQSILAVSRPLPNNNWKAIEEGQGLWRPVLLACALVLLLEGALAAAMAERSVRYDS